MTVKAKPAVRLLGDRVMVRPFSADGKTPGGILLPDQAQRKPQRGEVVAVGRGRVREDGGTEPMKVQAGDVIAYEGYGATELEVEGEKYIVLTEDHVVAVLPC